MDETVRTALVNLLDAFFNAKLQKDHMDQAPLTPDFTHFLCSDRIRLERTWLTFLHVLIECWQSPQMKEVASWLASAAPTEHRGLSEVLDAAQSDGTLRSIEALRHYMCHRDRRAYWDNGRTAGVGGPRFERTRQLHDAFDRLLRGGVRSTGEPPTAFCGEEYWYDILGDERKGGGAA